MAGALTRRAVVLAKIQTAEGSAATTSKYLNGLLISNLSFNPDAPPIERNFLRDSLSPLPHRVGRRLLNATFDFELKSGPAVGLRPEWSPLMRAAGMQETVSAVATSIRTALLMWTASVAGPVGSFYVQLAATGDPSLTNPTGVRENGEDMKRVTALASMVPGTFWYGDGDTLGYTTIYVMLTDSADPDSKALGFVESIVGTSITYDFRDTSHEFATIDIYPDGKLIRLVDALIDITSINFNAGGVPIVSARAVADYTTPTDVALPTSVNYQSHLPPIAQSMVFTLDAFAAGVVPSFSVNFANQLSERLDVNSPNGFKGMRYTGRNPTGQVTMEQELVAAFPAFTRWENGTEFAWSATLGSAGTRLTFSSPSVQITSITSADINNGIRGWNMGLKFNAPGLVKEWRIFVD
jgi:hypothetical protein